MSKEGLFARFSRGSRRSRIGIHLSAEEDARLVKKTKDDISTKVEVVRLSLAGLFDKIEADESVNIRLDKDEPSVYFEVDVAASVLKSLEDLRLRLALETMNQVVRVAINNFCGS